MSVDLGLGRACGGRTEKIVGASGSPVELTCSRMYSRARVGGGFLVRPNAAGPGLGWLGPVLAEGFLDLPGDRAVDVLVDHECLV
jgi:hypothetical protein